MNPKINEVRKKVEKMYQKEKYWEAPDSILEEMIDLMVKVYKAGKKEGQEEERQFILNVLDGVDIADNQNGNHTGGTRAIRHALQTRTII